MEGDPEDSGEDKTTVLWEKCIQQSIFVDLSEDESLHFSDLEASLALHLSKAESAASEASIHLSGSAELSALSDTSSESRSVSSQSVGVVESKTKSGILHVSAQRPNTMHEGPPTNQGYEDPGENTSDEDQEDLPYDGVLGSPYFNQTASSEGTISSDGRHTVEPSPDLPGQLELLQDDASAKEDNFSEASKPGEVAPPPCPGPADINQLLLRHFSQEELLRSGRLIEAETMPEVSLLESVDDTVFSLAPTHNSEAVISDHTESYDEKSKTASKNGSLKEETGTDIDHFTPAATDNNTSSSASTDSGQSSADGAKQEREEDAQVQRVPLVRTRSFSDMKYGQGQVHYPLPDFSKVAPKVKIPKAPSGPARSVPQCPSTMHRAQSSPGMLEVISRVLEDSVQPPEKPYVFKDDGKQTAPALVHHLQAEYDKLLTKYAEAENLIDQMRTGTNTQPSSELVLYLEHDDDDGDDQGESVEASHLRYVPPHLPSSDSSGEKGETALHSTAKEATTASSSKLQDGRSDGEKMTAELRDIISQFMQKVEEFKFSVSNMAVSTLEQQMMLRSLMEAQDQLERKYISKKDEHRALEMQNYMGLSRNTGTFDPDRLVEGDIFRIGMHLEDIKEMIDQNVCEQISPPHSSSTPTPVTASLHVRPAPSPPPSLHEGPSAGFSTASCEMDSQDKEEKEEEEVEEVEEAREVHINGGLDQSSDLITDDPRLKSTGYSCHSRGSLGSVEAPGILRAEDEEVSEEERSSVLSEVIDHSDILAYLNGAGSTSRQRPGTADSCSTLDSVLDPGAERDPGDCVSLAVEVSCSSDAPRDSDSHSLSEAPLNTSSVSQRIVSPETDSGFGSSYLNQSASGSFQPHLVAESVHSQNEGLSSSDSEGSCSNLQTAIHSAARTGHQWVSSHPSVPTRHREAAAAVEQWVESTTKTPAVGLQGSDRSLPAQRHHHVLSTTMDAEDGSSPLYSCSCNSEAIVALQSEVSRLKKDLEEGLVQLPHLAQKMDYLTSKYRQERQERRCKARSHQRPASVEKPSSGRGSSQVRIEDWISSDMEPSKSRGSGSGDTSCSEIVLHTSGGRSVRCTNEFQYKVQQPAKPNGGTEGRSSLKGENDGASESPVKQSPQTIMKSFNSKDRWALLYTPSHQKPLLQVSYGSSSSLPASYKVREPPLQSTSQHRKRSTQSDTALLPSDVYFQRTLSPVAAPSKTGSRTSRRRGSKEEDMNRTLDQAIEVARSMKRTTDRMARRLSADLAKAQLHKKLHNMQPPGGRRHQAS